MAIDSTNRPASTYELAERLHVDCTPNVFAAVNESRLIAIAEHILTRAEFASYSRYAWDDPLYWYPEGGTSERSQFFAVGNAINFRFWSLRDCRVVAAGGPLEGTHLVGSMYMWRCLRRCLDRGALPILDARFLASLDVCQFNAIFSDDTGSNPLEVALDERLSNLRDLGQRLQTKWGGSFHSVIDAAEGSLAAFVRLSADFRAYDDPLFKLTMVNAILHLGSGIAIFDSEPLPGIDYHLMKQLLRQGVVVPSGPLTEKLSRNLLLTAEEGHALRRAALCALIRISRLTGISGEILDNKLWWNRLKCRTPDPVCDTPSQAHECPFFGPCARLTSINMPLEETRYY